MSSPERTCCGCGQRAARSALVRLTAANGEVVLDLAGRRGGRGAYLHRDRSCCEAFVRGKVYVQSLRRRVPRGDRIRLCGSLGLGSVLEREAPRSVQRR
jgi:predicted RNA-binding protein YlxR (DUF448 family)